MNKKFIFSLAWVAFTAIASYGFIVNQAESYCANSITCAENLAVQVEENAKGVFLGQSVTAPNIDLSDTSYLAQGPEVLGEDTAESQDKRIYVDLSTQKLYAYDGNDLFLETLVSTGKWGRTPTGDFQIWIKLRSTKMSGGSGNDYYYLPNVPYVMFFHNDQVSKARGFSLHGTYWHNNFGMEMSHGCVNLRTVDAEKLYHWTTPYATKSTTYESEEDPGTMVSICNELEIQEGAPPRCLE